MGWMACVAFGKAGTYGAVIAAACGLYMYYMITNLGEGVYAAAHHYTGTWGACVAAKFYYSGGLFYPYAGYVLESC